MCAGSIPAPSAICPGQVEIINSLTPISAVSDEGAGTPIYVRPRSAAAAFTCMIPTMVPTGNLGIRKKGRTPVACGWCNGSTSGCDPLGLSSNLSSHPSSWSITQPVGRAGKDAVTTRASTRTGVNLCGF